LRFHQFTPERASGRAPMSVEDRQNKREHEKNASQPCRKLHQHVSGLRAENVFRDRPAKGRPQTFTFWTLHQYNKHHQQRHQYEESQKQIDEKVHRDGEYRR
jgi:hypothetical protein